MSKQVPALIFRMAAENPTWRAPRIHGELLKLGFRLSEITVSRWLGAFLREAWPYVPAHEFLLFDRDSKFGTDVISAVRDWGSTPRALLFAVRG